MKKMKVADICIKTNIMSVYGYRKFADYLIDFSDVTFNGEDRLGKEGHNLSIIEAYKFDPNESCGNEDYLYLIQSSFENERYRKNYLYAVYSTKHHKFILLFDYGKIEIQKRCIIAYCNQGTVIFSYTGEIIMPATKNVCIKILNSIDNLDRNKAKFNYFRVIKLRDDWLEKCIESGICKYSAPTLFEEWKAMYEYKKEFLKNDFGIYDSAENFIEKWKRQVSSKEHIDEPVGIYSIIEKKLVVPYKYVKCYGTNIAKTVRETDKAYLKAYDFKYCTLYSPEGECIVPYGKYDEVHVGVNRIIARKEFSVEKEEECFKVKPKIGKRCIHIKKDKNGNYFARYRCKNLVDIYSLEGNIIKENVLLYNYSNAKYDVTNLKNAYFIYFDEDEYKIKEKHIERKKRKRMQERIGKIKDMKNTIKLVDLVNFNNLLTSDKKRLSFADEIIDLNDITFNGEDRLGKKGHHLRLAGVFDIEPNKNYYNLDYEPNYICRIVSEFDYDKYSKLFAIYSTKLHKFILPFEYGNLEIKGACIFAYQNGKMSIFSHTGEVIMPLTKNIRLKSLDGSGNKQYVRVTKLRDDWLENIINSKSYENKTLTPFEEWRALYFDYELHEDELNGVYSLIEKKLIVPCRYPQCYGQSRNQEIDEAYIKCYDGIWSYALYTPDGKCIIPDGKYDNIRVQSNNILARKTIKISGTDAGIGTTEVLGPNCGRSEMCEYYYGAHYICESLVDIYSLSGEIIKENVWITNTSNSIKGLTNL